jgi:hypothetical protein
MNAPSSENSIETSELAVATTDPFAEVLILTPELDV